MLPHIIFGLGILNPTDPTVFTGIGNPVSLGQLTTTSPLTTGAFPVSHGSPGPDFGIDFATAIFGIAGFNMGTAPLTFVVVPEPTTALLLGAGLAALLALRRGRGPPA